MEGGTLPQRRRQRKQTLKPTKHCAMKQQRAREFIELLQDFKQYNFRSTIVNKRLVRKADREYVMNLLEADYMYREIIQHMGRRWFVDNWNKKDSVKTLFHKCGFRLNYAKELTDVIQPLIDSSYTLEQIFDLAFEYTLGRYDPIGKSGHHFLYDHAMEDEWFQQNAGHFIVNTQDTKYGSVMKIIDNHPLYSTSKAQGKQLYFHATNWRSSMSIAERIRHTRGRECLDFGSDASFYCTPNLNDALEWCHKKQNIFKNETCLIAFNVPEHLPYNVKIFDRVTKEWVTLVQESRLCHENALDSFDFVYGPMCANAKTVARDGKSPISHRPIKYQLCSKSDRGDEHLQQCMFGILYLSKY